jgi:nickel-type superoxide dismutase maturation protease
MSDVSARRKTIWAAEQQLGSLRRPLGWLLDQLVRALRWRPRRIVVHGSSMLPTLLPGDRILVLRARHLRVGDVVAVSDPRMPERLLIKRVVSVDELNANVMVAGDNPDASTDSTTFGPVARGAVVGRAVYRYAPSARAARLTRW